MITNFLTLRGYWASINKFYLEDTGELIKLAPITYLVDEVNKYLPGNAYINVLMSETEVLVNGRYPEVLKLNTVISFMFDKVLEDNTSLESPVSQ